MSVQEYLVPYVVSNAVALILIFISYVIPKIARYIWVVIFLAAGVLNLVTVLRTPEVYLVYGKTAILQIYKDFVYGFFSLHIRTVVVGIATGQILVAVLLIFKKLFFWLGVIGGVIFLVAIAPLGIGSAFPSTLLLAMGLIALGQRLIFTEKPILGK
jgi:hypothetical protein